MFINEYAVYTHNAEGFKPISPECMPGCCRMCRPDLHPKLNKKDLKVYIFTSISFLRGQCGAMLPFSVYARLSLSHIQLLTAGSA